jgi:hypothetical protein
MEFMGVVRIKMEDIINSKHNTPIRYTSSPVRGTVRPDHYLQLRKTENITPPPLTPSHHKDLLSEASSQTASPPQPAPKTSLYPP